MPSTEHAYCVQVHCRSLRRETVLHSCEVNTNTPLVSSDQSDRVLFVTLCYTASLFVRGHNLHSSLLPSPHRTCFAMEPCLSQAFMHGLFAVWPRPTRRSRVRMRMTYSAYEHALVRGLYRNSPHWLIRTLCFMPLVAVML